MRSSPKRFRVFLLAVLASLFLVACGGGNNGASDAGGDALISDDGGSPGEDSDGAGDANVTRSDTDGGNTDRQSPSVRFVQPTDGSSVFGEVAVELAVEDDVGVSEVAISVNGREAATLTEAPWNWTWKTSELDNGVYTLSAQAKDTAGKTATTETTVSLRPPCESDEDCPPKDVKFVTPVDGSEVCGTLAVEATASDDNAIDRIEFAVDGQEIGVAEESPYETEWNSTNAKNGEHLLRATAYDDSGQSYFSTNRVEVSNTGEKCDNVPNVRLTSPKDGAYVAGEVALEAEASDDTGVTGVVFYIDNGQFKKDESVPYKTTWKASEFDEGAHTLKARATDTNDQSTSHQIDVTVDLTPPMVSIESPVSGKLYDGRFKLKAAASDNFEIDRVEFIVDGGKWSKTSMSSEAEVEFNALILKSGQHDLEVIAHDIAGQTARASTQFLVDRTCNYKMKAKGVCKEQTRKTNGMCPKPPNYEMNETKCDGMDNDCDGKVDPVSLSCPWTRLIGTSDYDIADSVTTDGQGNVYVAGRTRKGLHGQPYTGGHGDGYVVKYDTTGTRQWTRLIGTSRRDTADSVTTDGQGNVYVAGSTSGPGLHGQTYNGRGKNGYVVKSHDPTHLRTHLAKAG